MHILQFFEKSSQKPKQTIWACQKCKNDIKYENPGENGPLGQKLGHFATLYPDASPDHISQGGIFNTPKLFYIDLNSFISNLYWSNYISFYIIKYKYVDQQFFIIKNY